MNFRRPIRRARSSEEGFILVSVMFLLAILIISMTVAMPKIIADIQRDREMETYHRGLQYRRAVQLYYRKFNRYPPNIDALVKTNQIRFLRKKYVDPTTGKDDWKPIMFGQQKTPLAMGFFGQPLGGAGFGGNALAGVGPQGGNGIPGANPIGGVSSAPTSIFGSSPTDPSAGATAGVGGVGGAAGTGTNPTDPNSGQVAGASPIGGQTFGGAGIVGFSPASPKQSIFVYKKKNHYNQWEFTYSPLSDMGMGGMQGGPAQLLPGQAPGTGGLQSTPSTGIGGSPISTPTAPTTPQ
jgi:type II secretory pathway pseudopilin PulG